MNATRKSLIVTFSLIALLLAVASGTAWAQGRKAVKAATGPFGYDPAVAGTSTFLGSLGGPAIGEFSVTAPSGGTIFPSGGSTALAEIRVFGIEMVGDADGVPLAEPVKIPLDSPLGMQIAGAYVLYPAYYELYPGETVDVYVEIYNPIVDASAYGDYVVTMKAQAVGSGIGVGSGTRYNLSLRPMTETDTTPPTVMIDSPADSSTHILGNIPVEIRANDPFPGSGVVSMSATISSAGGTVINQGLALNDDTPQPAGSDATATGTFTPTGGSGPAGASSSAAFDSLNRSGIGSYTLTAEATDGAGNTGQATSNFQVKYDIEFTQQEGHINNGQPNNSVGRFKFEVRRSSVTSDGAFMYDHTVVVQLVRTSDNTVMRAHTFFGPGSGVQNRVLIEDGDTINAVYHTNFRRGDLAGPPSGSDSYKAVVLFEDVDGNLVVQAESNPVSF